MKVRTNLIYLFRSYQSMTSTRLILRSYKRWLKKIKSMNIRLNIASPLKVRKSVLHSSVLQAEPIQKSLRTDTKLKCPQVLEFLKERLRYFTRLKICLNHNYNTRLTRLTKKSPVLPHLSRLLSHDIPKIQSLLARCQKAQSWVKVKTIVLFSSLTEVVQCQEKRWKQQKKPLCCLFKVYQLEASLPYYLLAASQSFQKLSS